MVDNIHFGPAAGANHALALLRAETIDKTVQTQNPLVPEVFFSLDPDVRVSGTLKSVPGEVLSLHLVPEGPTRWMSLNIRMGAADLSQCQWLGVICQSRAPQSVTFRIMLRSGVDGGHLDTMFRKTVVAYSEPSTHLDALEITRDPMIPRQARWRELILLFDTKAIDVTVLNFGVFAT